MNKLNLCVVFFVWFDSSYAIYVPNEHESKPSYTSMVKIPLYIKNPNSLQYYQNYSKVLFHNNNQNIGINNNASKHIDSTKTTRLFPVYSTHQETVHTKKVDESILEHPGPSTIVSQKVSGSGAVAEETLNERVVYKRRIDKGKQIEVYHNCPSGVTGQFVYDLSCNQFLDCWKGRGGPRNCAPGTLFNPKTLECDFLDKVECLTGPRKNTLSSASQKSQNLQIEQVTCPGGFSGLIPNYTDCTKFIRCNNGQQNSLDCPPGTLFDFTHNICDFPQKSICFNSYSSNYAIEQSYNNQQNQLQGQNNCKPHDRNCFSEYRAPYGYEYTQQESYQNTYVPHGQYHQTTHSSGNRGVQNCDPRTENCQSGSVVTTSQDGYGQFISQSSGSLGSTLSNCNSNDPSCTGISGIANGNQPKGSMYQSMPQKTLCNPQIQDCSLHSGLKASEPTHGSGGQTGTVLCNPHVQNCAQPNTYSHQFGSQPCNPQTQNCRGTSTPLSIRRFNAQPCNPQTQYCGQSTTYPTGGQAQYFGTQTGGYPSSDSQTQQFGTSVYPNNARPTQQFGSGVYPSNVGHTQQVYSSNNDHAHQFGAGVHLSNAGQTQQFGAGAGQAQKFGAGVYPNNAGQAQQFGAEVHPSNTGYTHQFETGIYPNNAGNTQQFGGTVFTTIGSQFGQGQYRPKVCDPLTQNCQQEGGYQQGSNVLGYGHENRQASGSGRFEGTHSSGTIGYGGNTQNYGGTNNQQYGGVNYETVCNINDRKCQQREHIASSTPSSNWNRRTSSLGSRPKCPNGFQGITRHPGDCKKFLNCANGITYVQDCADGTLFNPLSGICDFANNVDCDNSDETTTLEVDTEVNNNFYAHTTSTTQRNLIHYYHTTPSSSNNNEQFIQTTTATCAGRQCYTQNYGQVSGSENTEYNNNNPQYTGSQNIRPGSVHIQNSGTYGTNTRYQEENYGNANQYQTIHTNQHAGPTFQQSTTSSSSTQSTINKSNIYKIPLKNKVQHSFQQVPDYVDVFDPSDNKNLYARSSSTTQKPQKVLNGVWPPPYPETDTNADYVFEYEDGEPVTLEPENIYVEKKVKRDCGRDDFFCDAQVCVPKAARCNGIPECPNGKDEEDCQENVELFVVHNNARLEVLEKQRWDNVSYTSCAVLCLETNKFECKSFNYRKIEKTCFLTDKNIGLSGGLKSYYAFDYYELKNASMDCSRMHICPNGKCLMSDQVCNGINDCGDRADEKGCRASDFGYNVKLAGGNKRSEGRIEVTVFGQTGYICDDQFDLKDANIACKELGYELGAIEIRGNSFFAKDLKEKNTLYMMDDIECIGNETSLLECDFAGWGIHNCKDQEIVGVVCRTPEEKCAKNYWKCDTLNECVPIDFVCDGLYDCSDNSDEASQHCEAPTELRLVNGSNSNEGRIEIKHHGIWGTVCDDDFNDDAAKVICKYLGYVGMAKVQKDGYYGAGEGPIWLDQVSCYGNETNLEDCTHWKWGEHNCDHSEDVGVVCSNDVNEVEVQRHSKAVQPNAGSFGNRYGQSLEPVSCGYRKDNIFLQEGEVHFRVVQGSVAKKGDYPWQAAIRVKRQEKSAHWCGAVVVSSKWVLTAAHCLDGYPKGAYVVVAGEYDTDENEGTEQQAYIEEYYLHNNFRQGHKMANDIALIKLKGHGFRLNQDIQPICLPDVNSDYENELNCTISGFGSIQSGSAVYSHSLRAAWIPIQKMEVCKMAHIYGKSITEGMVCAGYLDGGVDACDGDSGGPLACLDHGVFTLYGLTSWGQRCGIANKPGVYVKVAYYRTWIDRIIKAHS